MEAGNNYIMRSLKIIFFIKFNYRNQAKENGLNGAHDKHGRRKKVCWEDLKGNDNLADLGIDGRQIKFV